MNDWNIIQRIAWKDYRRISGLWFALLAFWLICFAYSSYSIFQRKFFTVPWNLEVIGIGIFVTAMIYALGWASVTFAAEHEDKTYDYLRSLPITGKNVFYGKLLFGVVSTLMLIIVLAALGGMHLAVLKMQSGQFDANTFDPSIGQTIIVTCLVLIPLAMAIGMFWSMRIKRPLVALTIAGVSLPLTLWLGLYIVAIIVYLTGWGSESMKLANEPPTWTIVTVGILGNLLFFVDYRMALRWLPTAQGYLSLPIETSQAPVRMKPSGFGRLVWLQVKQNATMCLGVVVLAIAAMWCFNGTRSLATADVGVLCSLAGLIGVLTFRADQEEDRFRLLAQLGVGTFSYWLSCLLIPLLSAFAIGFLALYLSDGMGMGSASLQVFSWAAFGFVLVTFGLGQFYSLTSNSSIIACGLTLVTSLLLCPFLFFCTGVQVPVLFTWLPAITLPLLATYLRIPRWFRQTRSWRQWVVPGIAMALLFVAMPLSVIGFRVYEIPFARVPQEIGTIRTPSAAEVAKAKEYSAIIAELPTSPSSLWVEFDPSNPSDYTGSPELATLANDNEFMARLERVTKGVGAMPPYDRDDVRLDPAAAIASLFVLRAKRHEAEDNAELAWADYESALQVAAHRENVHSIESNDDLETTHQIERDVYLRLVPWAMLNSNSPEQVEHAADFINRYRTERPTWRDEIYRTYQVSESYLDFDDDASISVVTGPSRQQFDSIRTFVPWEVTRARRFRDYSCVLTYEFLEQNDHLEDSWSSAFHELRYGSKINHLESTTMIPFHFDGSEAIPYGDIENTRRGTIYQLAAIAYHLRNDKYPDNLASLTLGDRQLPPDFYVPNSSMQRRGNAIVSAKLGATSTNAEPAGKGSQRAFLLPEFRNWKDYDLGANEYEQRRSRYKSGTVKSTNATTPRDIIESLMADHPAEMGPYVGWFLPPLDTEQEGNPMRARVAVPYQQEPLDTVREILNSSEDDTRLAIIRELKTKEVYWLKQILPELKELLSSGSPVVAGEVARCFQSAIGSSIDWRDVGELVSRSLHGENAIPIRNPKNGHFYEMVSMDTMTELADGTILGSFDAAIVAAQNRSFQGMRGHLVTITSKDENDFLIEAFPEYNGDSAAWTAGRYDAKAEAWIWDAGPEKGEVFWPYEGEESETFANWATPPKVQIELELNAMQWIRETADIRYGVKSSFNNWFGNRPRGDLGQWQAVALAGPNIYDLGTFLVEYSPSETLDDAKTEDAKTADATSKEEAQARDAESEPADITAIEDEAMVEAPDEAPLDVPADEPTEESIAEPNDAIERDAESQAFDTSYETGTVEDEITEDEITEDEIYGDGNYED